MPGSRAWRGVVSAESRADDIVVRCELRDKFEWPAPLRVHKIPSAMVLRIASPDSLAIFGLPCIKRRRTATQAILYNGLGPYPDETRHLERQLAQSPAGTGVVMAQ